MTTNELMAEAMKLSPEDRLAIAESLFSSISMDDEPDLEFSPEFVAELDRRYQHSIDHPESVKTWDEIKRELSAGSKS